MAKQVNEFEGKTGTIYIEPSTDTEPEEIDVWFEDFMILGSGPTRAEALQAAYQSALSIAETIQVAINEEASTVASASGD